MKYWFFDGNDVVGPFTPQELAARADFSVATGLVCPENFSEDGDSWKPASSFADFGPDALSSGSTVSSTEKPAIQTDKESSAEEAALFDKEMDTFLKNPSILAGTATPAPEGPALEIPKKPAKPGPIEDYFNNINGEDLGDILGIPEANENSDMNLPRVVDGPFENTTPPVDKEIDFVEISAENEGEELALSVPGHSQQPQAATVAEKAQLTEGASLPSESFSVKREDGGASVPISVAEEEALVVFPGEDFRKAEELSAVDQTTTSKVAPASVQEDPAEETAKEASTPVEEEVLSTCTLPVIGERENKASLPTLPTEGAPLIPSVQPAADFVPQQEESAPSSEPMPSVSSPAAIKPEAAPREAVLEEAPVKPAIVTAAAQQEPGPQGTSVTVDEATPQSPSPVEPHLNQVKPRLKRTPEIERFLSTQSQIIRRSNQRKADFMLWVLIVLLVIGGVLVLFRFFNNRPSTVTRPVVRKTRGTVSAVSPRPASASVVSAAPAVPVSAGRNALATEASVPVNPPAALTAADKALAAVQNYQLPGGKGTISSYFDRIYKTQLAQGYTGEWSAEALHKNTYIVKYRLSKTRMEPIVYVFQADAAQGKLTGALNNIALDLLGKI